MVKTPMMPLHTRRRWLYASLQTDSKTAKRCFRTKSLLRVVKRPATEQCSGCGTFYICPTGRMLFLYIYEYPNFLTRLLFGKMENRRFRVEKFRVQI